MRLLRRHFVTASVTIIIALLALSLRGTGSSAGSKCPGTQMKATFERPTAENPWWSIWDADGRGILEHSVDGVSNILNPCTHSLVLGAHQYDTPNPRQMAINLNNPVAGEAQPRGTYVGDVFNYNNSALGAMAVGEENAQMVIAVIGINIGGKAHMLYYGDPVDGPRYAGTGRARAVRTDCNTWVVESVGESKARLWDESAKRSVNHVDLGRYYIPFKVLFKKRTATPCS